MLAVEVIEQVEVVRLVLVVRVVLVVRLVLVVREMEMVLSGAGARLVVVVPAAR